MFNNYFTLAGKVCKYENLTQTVLMFILLLVQPKVWVHNQLVGAPLGHDVTIECVIEAYPKSITYWQKIEDGKEKIILNG